MRKNTYLTILYLLCHFSAVAQFVFQNLNEKDGLSSKNVRCIYKDRDGIVWLGTANGLNRYDGNFIKRYNSGQGQKDLQICAVYPIDNDKKLLVGTFFGLLIFDKKLGAYVKDARFASMSTEPVLAVRKDDLGWLWLVGQNQIHVYTGTKIVDAATLIPEVSILKKQDFSFSAASAFCWDARRKGFWIGGRNSFFLSLDKQTLFGKHYNPENIPILNDSIITAITIDKKGGLWYSSTYDKKLCYWNATSNAVTTYRHFDEKPITDGCNFLFVDRQNRLWISTYMYAAYFKDQSAPIRKVPYSQDAPYSIAYGYFQDALEDEEGDLWFATVNGVSKNQAQAPIQSVYKLPSFDFFLDTGFAHANSIAIEGDTIVASKEDGIILYNTNRKTYKRYTASNPKNYQKNSFYMSAKVGKEWWFAGSDGVYILDGAKNKLTRFEETKSNHHFARFVFKDKTGKVWFQTDALYRYDPVLKDLQKFDGKDPRYGLFEQRYCQSYLILRNGNILFAVNKVGFLIFDTKKEIFSVVDIPTKSQFYVRETVQDHEGNLWCATIGRGLLKMSLDGRILDSLCTANGFPFDDISNLAIDVRRAIWASNSDGMLFFKPYNKEITKVNIDLGKTLQDYWNEIYVKNGKIYAVMLDHVVVIDPLKFSTIPVKSSPRITSIKVFEKEITDYPKLEYLELSPDQNSVRFQYTSPNHRDVPSLQYSYRLVGVDDRWVNAGRSLNAFYNNLRPGDYTFIVRSTNEHGRWMNDVTKLEIHLEPHWWESWWFLLIVATGLGLLMRLGHNAYSLRKQRASFDVLIDYFANSVYGENSIHEICWDIARNCISQLHFEDCVVYLLDDQKEMLVQKAAFGIYKNSNEHEIVNPLKLRIGEGIVGTVAMNKKALVIPDTSKDDRYVIDDHRRLSEIAVPILHEGQLLGVIDSEHSRKNFFTSEHTRLLSTIASISANKIAEALAEKQAQQKEMMLLEINKMYAESQLMALRAQMNPHFVFNCLNSIQECIVTEKYSEASKYLNKFSKLFRMVLNNSDRNLVTIEEEMNVLELYLELEKMRFENSFTYEFIVDEDLEVDEIVLPSMLLQPYVENALWHGLMHKPLDRRLTISFERLSEDIFKCVIEDNGIGRRRSGEIKEFNSKAKRHKSKGLQIAKDRLTLIERQGQHACVDIIDKYSTGGEPLGTMVVIELSTFLNYT